MFESSWKEVEEAQGSKSPNQEEDLLQEQDQELLPSKNL